MLRIMMVETRKITQQKEPLTMVLTLTLLKPMHFNVLRSFKLTKQKNKGNFVYNKEIFLMFYRKKAPTVTALKQSESPSK